MNWKNSFLRVLIVVLAMAIPFLVEPVVTGMVVVDQSMVVDDLFVMFFLIGIIGVILIEMINKEVFKKDPLFTLVNVSKRTLHDVEKEIKEVERRIKKI